MHACTYIHAHFHTHALTYTHTHVHMCLHVRAQEPFIQFVCRLGIFTAALQLGEFSADEVDLARKKERFVRVLGESSSEDDQDKASTVFAVQNPTKDAMVKLFKDIVDEAEINLENRGYSRILREVPAELKRERSREASGGTRNWDARVSLDMLEFFRRAIDAAADPDLYYGPDDEVSKNRQTAGCVTCEGSCSMISDLCMKPSPIRTQLVRLHDAVQKIVQQLRRIGCCSKAYEKELLPAEETKRAGDRVFIDLEILDFKDNNPLPWVKEDLWRRCFHPAARKACKPQISFWSGPVKK